MLFRFRPLLDIFFLLIPVLTSYYFSRRFEYAADAASVEYTHDAEAAIRGLANLHRLTQVPTDCDRLSELFLTHPAFTRRAWAIGESSRMPADRLSEVIHQARLRAADSL
jgi:Zn-dependent protease with chaperone function